MTPNALARTLVAGAFVTASSFAFAAAPTPRQIVQTALPSVVVLVTEDEAGRQLTLGSGFFVGEGVIAAGLHLLDGARGGYYKHIGYKKRFPIEGIVGIDRANDLVLLSAPGARARARRQPPGQYRRSGLCPWQPRWARRLALARDPERHS